MGRPEDRYVEVRGVRARYWSVGERGPTVLLIHGMGASVESWLRNLDALARCCRVECVDLIGYGKSDKPDMEYGVTAFARFVADFMTARAIGRAHVVGHSLGGAVALQLHADHPERVDKLALITPAGVGRQLPLALRLLNVPLLGEALSRPGRTSARRFFGMLVHDPATIAEAELEEFTRLSSVPGANRVLLSTVRASSTIGGVKREIVEQVGAELRRIDSPTLLIWGRQDRLHRPAFAESARRACPALRLEWIDECGHAPAMEHPERVNALLCEFLAA